MKRTILCIFLALAMILLLAGCGCEHEWERANCTDPKTCEKCGETKGAPRGHSWKAATCTEPKTCEDCKATEGKELGHTWEEATCTLPKKCANCHETVGEPISHEWQEATTEAPKTCIRCQATEGEKLKTDPRFTTAATKELHGKWVCEAVFSELSEDTKEYFGDLMCTVSLEFGKTGDAVLTLDFPDRFAFMEGFTKMTVDMTYEALMAQGLSKADAAQTFQQYYGMTVEEYVKAELDKTSQEEIFEQFISKSVYYVGNNGLYIGESWYDEFDCGEFTLENGVLTIQGEELFEGKTLSLTKVEE